jgi:hypothetical protein
MSQQLSVPKSSNRTGPRPPGDRDLEIYKKVKIQLQEQWVVAQDLNLHYSRVSQIVNRVGRWLAAGGSPTDPALRDHAARQRLSRATLRLRLERALELATHAMESNLPPQTTTRRRLVGGAEVWREEVDRHQPAVNLSAVRLLLRAADSLRAWEGQGGQEDEPPTEQGLIQMVFDVLCQLRMRAEQEGRIAPCLDIRTCFAAALNMLIGANLPTNLTKEAMLNSL